MRRRIALAAIAALTATLLALSALRVDAHPIHSTLAEVTLAPDGRLMRAVVRAFVDDLGAAVHAGSDDEITRYVVGSFTVLAQGTRIATRGCGVTRRRDLVWVCVESVLPASGDVAVRSAVLSEHFADQINIVQATIRGAKRSLVFTRGDGAKPLF